MFLEQRLCDNPIHFNLDFANSTNFQSLEVVDLSSETQLQVAENLNFLAQCLFLFSEQRVSADGGSVFTNDAEDWWVPLRVRQGGWHQHVSH